MVAVGWEKSRALFGLTLSGRWSRALNGADGVFADRNDGGVVWRAPISNLVVQDIRFCCPRLSVDHLSFWLACSSSVCFGGRGNSAVEHRFDLRQRRYF